MLSNLIRHGFVITANLMWLTSCLAQPVTNVVITPIATETATPTGASSAAPLTTPTPGGPIVLNVWLPESLVPISGRAAEADFAQQITAFEAGEPDIQVETRLKKPQDIGGIMETLRTASAVAPGALPDLTLLRREDLLVAVQSGLIQPLDERAYAAHLSGFYTSALELGSVNGKLYGLAYALDTRHLAYYDPAGSDALQWRFEDILANNQPFVFAAGRNIGVNDVFLAQYVAAGGTAANGTLGPMNTNALRDTFTFYEQAVATGLMSPALLDHTTPEEFTSGLADKSVSAAVITSTQYLTLRETQVDLLAAAIPTESGKSLTTLNGWMWVMVTSNADRQAAATRWLNWMMAAERQGHFTQIVHLIPSQRDAVLRRWEPAPYSEFINSLLDNAIIPISASTSSGAVRAMQNALAAVLQGQSTAQEATQDVMDQVGG